MTLNESNKEDTWFELIAFLVMFLPIYLYFKAKDYFNKKQTHE